MDEHKPSWKCMFPLLLKHVTRKTCLHAHLRTLLFNGTLFKMNSSWRTHRSAMVGKADIWLTKPQRERKSHQGHLLLLGYTDRTDSRNCQDSECAKTCCMSVPPSPLLLLSSCFSTSPLPAVITWLYSCKLTFDPSISDLHLHFAPSSLLLLSSHQQEPLSSMALGLLKVSSC